MQFDGNFNHVRIHSHTQTYTHTYKTHASSRPSVWKKKKIEIKYYLASVWIVHVYIHFQYWKWNENKCMYTKCLRWDEKSEYTHTAIHVRTQNHAISSVYILNLLIDSASCIQRFTNTISSSTIAHINKQTRELTHSDTHATHTHTQMWIHGNKSFALTCKYSHLRWMSGKQWDV